MSFRDLKKKARADLHERMKVPAFYYATGNIAQAPVLIHVRVHTKLNREQGDLKGTSFSYAEVEEHIPALLFWLDECKPKAKAVVMISADEGYRVDHLRQPDILSQIGEVVQLNQHERMAFSYPGA